MNHHQTLRLTPSNSPFFKTSTPKSPTKSKSEEPGLQLKKVIGTTTASANGFDCLPSARQFAYTAGAAAVVSTVDADLNVTQRFFRARPTLAAGLRETNGSWPISPSPDPRTRVLGGLRDQSAGGSPLGANSRDWPDSPTGKSTTAKDRVKAATSVALSPNGKWVAMGETGYKPRILIFSNKGESSEVPACALVEHTFGVHALAFSPDSKYLASLGTFNDGFLYIWSIDDRTGAATLHSSNKCTVFVNVMMWVGRSLLTVGLRFVKFWRPDDEPGTEVRNVDATKDQSTPRIRASDFGNSILSPRHKFLPGKNSLLGDLIDANFVTASAISDDRAVVCTDGGDVCLLDDCQTAQTLTSVAMADFRITAARLDDNGALHVSGPAGNSRIFKKGDLNQRSPSATRKDRRKTTSPSKSSFHDVTTTIAMASIDNIVLELDSKRGIRLTKSGEQDEDTAVASHQLPAHNDAVLGVQGLKCECLPQAAFLSFAGNGSVRIWDFDGAAIANVQVPVEASPEMYDMTNELKAVSHLPATSLLAAGDKYGMVRIFDIATGQERTQVRAHSTEVADIVAFESSGVQLVATASRDRTVQLFTWRDEKLALLQTMDEHAAAVNGLLVASGGDILLSSSADRTVVVREAVTRPNNPSSVAFLMLRTITLKSSPSSMCLTADEAEMLVSTVDRCINTYNFQTGQAGFSFKCSDTEGGEAAALSNIIYASSLNANPTIIGVSSGDKSVRLYSDYGSLIARDWGHTEGITDVALLPAKSSEDGQQDSRPQLITVAADSTIFMWDTVSPAPSRLEPGPEANGICETPTTKKLTTPMGPPLRKVLSYSELSRFQRRKSGGDGEQQPSPPAAADTPTQPAPPPSPHRLKKKPSRISVAQPPRLEPAFRSNFAEPAGRRNMRKRSPSPPSPRTKKEIARKPSLGMSLRSKSSENVLSSYSSGASATATNASGFGSLNSSTESVCRTLRAYRKKLANTTTSDIIAPEILRELEKELKLTARVVGEKSQGKNLDEAMMSKLLHEASEKIVSRLDGRIKERVESEMRKSSEGSPSASATIRSPDAMDEDKDEQMDAVTGALEKVALDA